MQTTDAAVGVELVETRRAVYRFLLAALEPPSPAQHAWLAHPDFRSGLARVCEEFGLDCPQGEWVPAAWADHESRYLACFEVGLPGPPVPLLASHYNRREPTPRIVHEHILLYRRFGARVREGSPYPADHLVNELAFLIRLDELLLAGEVEAESLLRARLDLLTRHVAPWSARAAAAAEGARLPAIYLTLLRLLALAAQQDRELTAAALALAREEP
jgi:TorA maturation chaperone TorD